MQANVYQLPRHAPGPEEVADIIIPLHVITGSDHTSGFYGDGKKQVLEKVITEQNGTEV